MSPSPNAVPGVLGALAGLLPRRASARRPDLERELEEARRLGHWFTEEDRQLVREHEARLAAERRGELMRRTGQGGAVALLLMATVLPLLWPLALIGSVKAFPSTSRRVGFGLLALTGLGLIASTVLVMQLGRGLLAPQPAPALAPSSPPAAAPASSAAGESLGREIAERLNGATDYWTMEGTNPDGTAIYRKGLYRSWNGRSVMVLPSTTWAYLSPRERQALARYVANSRGVEAIHVGRLTPSTGFAGNTISVDQQVWP